MVLRALNSILGQTYQDIEIIVVDDSPEDYALRESVKEAVLSKKTVRPETAIRYIPHEKNRGACAARNTGLMNAEGEYVAYLDDDDEWMPKKLEEQMKVMEYSDAALVYCGYLFRNDETMETRSSKTAYHRGKVLKELLYRNFIDSTSIPLIRTECLKAAGGFDPEMESAQDYDAWIRIAEKYEIDYVKDHLVIYHKHKGEQISSNPGKKIRGLERLNRKYDQYIKQDAALWWRRNIVIVPHYAANGEMEKAKQIWRQCVRKKPFYLIENMRCFKNLYLRG